MTFSRRATLSRRVALAALLLALGACDGFFDMQTTRPIDIPDAGPRLVVNSVFEPGMPMAVVVERSYVSGEPSGPFVPASYPPATVELYDGAVRVETLRRIERYQTFLSGPRRDSVFVEAHYQGAAGLRPGVAYTVRASAPGLPATDATDAAPTAPVARVSGVRRTTVAGRRGVAVQLTLDDGPGDDRYALWALDPLSSTGAGPAPLLVLSTDPLLRSGLADLTGVDAPELLEAGFGARAFFFTDEDFAGRAHTFDLRLFGRNGRDVSRATLVVSRVSETYYRYERARFAQSVTQENPLAEPVTIPSNVRGGLGIVAGRTSTRFDVRVAN